ncbi:hypothetical protein [uncultured Sphingomonas sp.]|uniref:hypothetical protein n=1 Tax=uncultured Sphingomonas sp. TaxID=158754 RepID=UPI0035CCA1EE
MRLRSLPDDDDDVIVAPPGGTRLAAREAGVHPLLAAALDPAGPLAGPIGQLRLQLAGIRRPDGTPARLVAIAGIDAPDETALIAAALAVTTARAGYQALLVDACLSRPMLHPLFGCGNAMGLTTLMPARLAGDALQPTGQPRLLLLSPGPRVDGEESFIDGARLFGKLRTLADRFQSILVLSQGDPGIVAGTSEGFDGAVLVVRRDVSSTRRLQAAAAALAERKTPLIGIVCVH